MKKRELSDDIVDIMDHTGFTLSEVIKLLDRFNIGEYCETFFQVLNDSGNTTEMIRYVNQLKEEGLDIGRGDAKFGYRMPIPEKRETKRYLQIFRRN